MDMECKSCLLSQLPWLLWNYDSLWHHLVIFHSQFGFSYITLQVYYYCTHLLYCVFEASCVSFLSFFDCFSILLMHLFVSFWIFYISYGYFVISQKLRLAGPLWRDLQSFYLNLSNECFFPVTLGLVVSFWRLWSYIQLLYSCW